jgi:hypothetical protein
LGVFFFLFVSAIRLASAAGGYAVKTDKFALHSLYALLSPDCEST